MHTMYFVGLMPGRVVHADPRFLQLTPRLLSVLDTKRDEPFSNFAFNFNMRHYSRGGRRTGPGWGGAGCPCVDPGLTPLGFNA